MTPLTLYAYDTPNGQKAAIMLEETGLPYEVRVVDIERGEQRAPEFLALNPNGKIPVLVDPDRGRTLWESGAILIHLADRSGVLKPADEGERITALQWMLFQAAHVGPTLGQYWNFAIFAEEKLPAVIARFEREARRLLGVLDARLARHAHLAGDRYGVADVMTWPWIEAAATKLGFSLDDTPNLARWREAVGARPAVRRGLDAPHAAAAARAGD